LSRIHRRSSGSGSGGGGGHGWPNLHEYRRALLEQKTIVQISEAFYKRLRDRFKEYLLFGGMPEVAAHFLESNDITRAQDLQDQILRAYTLDFVKHAKQSTSAKIQQAWNSIPSQLAKENKKFIYKTIRTGARAREFEIALQWLAEAGLIYKVSKTTKIGIPLKAYEDVSVFKLYLFETGLLARLSRLDPTIFYEGSNFFSEFKGSLAENYVAQCLSQSIGTTPNYWTSAGKAEVGFIIEHGTDILPIEVKSGSQTKAKSLAMYKKKYRPALRIRISDLNLKQTDDLLNVPLFLVDQLHKLIGKLL